VRSIRRALIKGSGAAELNPAPRNQEAGTPHFSQSDHSREKVVRQGCL
jgi:hypothetical protein